MARPGCSSAVLNSVGQRHGSRVVDESLLGRALNLLCELVEKLVNGVRRTGDNGPFSANDDRALHEHRVLQEQLDNRITGDIVFGRQSELFKVFVLANKVGWFVGELIEKLHQLLTAQGVFQVFNNVELDVAVTQDIQRASRLSSTLVVVDRQFFHGKYP